MWNTKKSENILAFLYTMYYVFSSLFVSHSIRFLSFSSLPFTAYTFSSKYFTTMKTMNKRQNGTTLTGNNSHVYLMTDIAFPSQGLTLKRFVILELFFQYF